MIRQVFYEAVQTKRSFRTENLECQSNRIFIHSYLQYIISGQFMVVWRWDSSKFDLRVVEQSSICHLKQVSIKNNLEKPAKNDFITYYGEICPLPSFYFLQKKWTGNNLIYRNMHPYCSRTKFYLLFFLNNKE
jgi:hypothetical protein